MTGGNATRALALGLFLAALHCSPGEGFGAPTKVAFLADGTPLVADGYDNSRVAVLARGGGVVRAFGMPGGGPGELDLVHGIAVDRDDRIYVADRRNARVQVFERDGTHRASWQGPRIGRPFAVAVSGERVFVVDGGDQDPERPAARVVVLDREGRLLGEFSGFGTGPGQLSEPHDLVVDAQGRVYVAELGTGRVQRFRPRSP